MKIKGGGCACNCRGFDPNESKCDCYGRQKPICNVGGRRACGNGKFVASCYNAERNSVGDLLSSGSRECHVCSDNTGDEAPNKEGAIKK